MPAYLLEPDPEKLWHADWTATDHQIECVVIAEDESRARQYAADRFRADPAQAGLSDPWTQVDLVRVRRLDSEKDKAPDFPAGTVIPFMGIKMSAA
jgi:hypothetical protein